jgi:serine/threonine protein kinase
VDIKHLALSSSLVNVIDNKYRIVKAIDIGGFGSVHLATHESLGKRYAIKY